MIIIFAPLYALQHKGRPLLFVVDIQDYPNPVHVAHYGQPTVTSGV
jgi:hypothetical protein